ncbi:MAG: hypothetical protein AAF497_03255 [Planctomycetota bacterium]
MTFVGKLLTVMIFVMSILFMGFAVMSFTTQRNYKALVNGGDGQPGLSQQLNETRQKVREREAAMQAVQAQLDFETAARRSALVQLEVRATELQSELKQTQTTYQTAVDEQRKNNETVANAQVEMTRLKNRVDELRAELAEEIKTRNTRLEKVTELTDKLNQGEGDLRRLQTRSRQFSGAAGY